LTDIELAFPFFQVSLDIGISYFTFHKTEATSWETLRKLVDAIR
jgi:hypothetical protein